MTKRISLIVFMMVMLAGAARISTRKLVLMGDGEPVPCKPPIICPIQ